MNNRDVSQATHLEAVDALLQPTSEVILLVRHDPQPAGLKVNRVDELRMCFESFLRK